MFPVFYPSTFYPPALNSKRRGKHFYSLGIARVKKLAIPSARISLVFALISPFIVLLVVAISLVSITFLILLVPFLLVAFVSIRGCANALLLSTLFGVSVGIVAVHIGIIVLLILVGTLAGLFVFSRILCLLFLRRFSAHHFLL